jgi:hypothetical protein
MSCINVSLNFMTYLMNIGQNMSMSPFNQSMLAKVEFYIFMTKEA